MRGDGVAACAARGLPGDGIAEIQVLETIAEEEGGHASLAWRTVRWACSVDPQVCLAVRRVLPLPSSARFEAGCEPTRCHTALKGGNVDCRVT